MVLRLVRRTCEQNGRKLRDPLRSKSFRPLPYAERQKHARLLPKISKSRSNPGSSSQGGGHKERPTRLLSVLEMGIPVVSVKGRCSMGEVECQQGEEGGDEDVLSQTRYAFHFGGVQVLWSEKSIRDR